MYPESSNKVAIGSSPYICYEKKKIMCKKEKPIEVYYRRPVFSTKGCILNVLLHVPSKFWGTIGPTIFHIRTDIEVPKKFGLHGLLSVLESRKSKVSISYILSDGIESITGAYIKKYLLPWSRVSGILLQLPRNPRTEWGYPENFKLYLEVMNYYDEKY